MHNVPSLCHCFTSAYGPVSSLFWCYCTPASFVSKAFCTFRALSPRMCLVIA